MSVRKVFTEVRVPCIYYIDHGSDIEHCQSGIKDSMDCFMCYEGEIWEKDKIEEE